MARLIAPLALLLVAVVAFLPTVAGEDWVWDDPILVVGNRFVATASPAELLTAPLWSGTPLERDRLPYHRPLFLLDLRLDRWLSGGDPSLGLARLHSLGWHLLAVALLWALARRRAGEALGPMVGVGLFALHPVQTEVVGFVAARNDAMVTALLLAALLALERPRTGPAGLALAAPLAAAAALSKETGYLAAGFLLLLDLGAAGRPGPARRYAALLAGGLAALLLRRLSGVAAGAGCPLDAAALARVAAGAGQFLQALAAPATTASAAASLEAPSHLPARLAGGALLVLLLVPRRREVLAGLALAALGLAPSLLAVACTGFAPWRYLHLPLAGLGLAVAAAVASGPAARVRRVLLLLPLLCAAATAATGSTWRSDRELWGRAWRLAPGPSSACGLFKARERAGAAPGDTLPLLATALGPPPAPHCCLSASRYPLEALGPAGAVRWGRRALAAGCAPGAELLAPLALAEALTCDWGPAEEHARAAGRDPFGYVPVVLSAAALRRGDPGELERWRAVGGGELPLEEQVRMLLARCP